MQCPKCGSENGRGDQFCGDCGASLSYSCPKCGADNPADKKFCRKCGSSLVAADLKAAATAESAVDGERRHLTVLFCDLVNSTAIAAHMDPEEWHVIAADYQHAAAEAATRVGGHVAKYLGDGLVVYFGWPEAHEDDGERAVRAGLGIVEAVSGVNARHANKPNTPKLAVRVGIDTGAVVVGRGGGKDADVFGDAPNIASRVQSEASPESVLITDTVHKLVAGLFAVEDRGDHQLKGIEHPVRLHRVIAPIAARRRMHGGPARVATPFVGRADEVRLLLNRWESAREGEGQVALIMGEAGIGKSRLLEEFRAQIKGDSHLWIECAGERFSANSPFHAAIQMLDQGLGWRGDESKEERAAALERSLELSQMKMAEAMPLIAELLNLPIPEKYPALPYAPEQKRRRLMANLAAWLLNAAGSQPVIFTIEDLHWVDPSSLELTRMLVEQAATARLLLLYTARPEFRATWPMRSHHVQITLNRLNDRYTREMVAGVAARAALSKDLIDAVVKRTDGVPLFAEELTRLMVEGEGRAPAREIPATLHDSLMARLDRLGPAKEVAQIGAVIGREFSYELIEAVSRMPEEQLQPALQKLTDSELIYARGIAPDATYQFKHALIQDAAYEALLKSRRRELHRRVAQTITEKFKEIEESHPEILARHWSDAGETEPAIAAWAKAGDIAERRNAVVEAEQPYRQALAMLKTLPESAERDKRERDLVYRFYQVLFQTRGYAAPEAVEVLQRMAALVEKTGQNLAATIFQDWGRSVSTIVAGDYAGGYAIADRMFEMAKLDKSPASMGAAHSARLLACYYRGEFGAVEEHFGQLALYWDAPAYKTVVNALVSSLYYAAISAVRVGHFETARNRMAQAIAMAQERKVPYEMAVVRAWHGMLLVYTKDYERGEAACREGLAICEEHSITSVKFSTRLHLGLARARLGAAVEGAAMIREAMVFQTNAGAGLIVAFGSIYLAEAQKLEGALDDAMRSIENAVALIEKGLRPYALTVRAELHDQMDHRELAEADFREAIALEQKMGSLTFALRAATGLARLLQARGDCEAAREVLATAYKAFPDGFEPNYLKEAKDLLDALDVEEKLRPDGD